MKSSVRISSPDELKEVPLRMPDLNPSSIDHESKSAEDWAVSSFEISTQLSTIVAFVGTLKAVNSEPSGPGFTTSGPLQSATLAWVVGSRSMRAVMMMARLALA